MAAYGAIESLLSTLWKFQGYPQQPQPGELSRAVRFLKRFLVSKKQRAEIETQIHVESIFIALYYLKRFLEENRDVKAEFETQIRDAVYEAQDIVDTHTWSTHFLSPSEVETCSQSFHGDLERVKQKINLIAQMTREEFNHLTLDRKISNSIWRNYDEIKWLKMNYPVVGRDEDIYKLKDRLMNGSDALQVVPIVAIAGMGKTTLAYRLLKDRMIVNHFDAIGWVKVSVKYNKRDKLLDIIASLRKSSTGLCVNYRFEERFEEVDHWSDEIQQKTDEQLVKHIHSSLKYKRYIILLDDVRDVASWNDLKELFPDYYQGSRILLTTRDVEVAPGRPHLLDRLSDEVTLALLEKVVFDREPCPAHLAIIAKDIAWSCRGLPHAVVIVGKLLSCAHPTAEYWEVVLSSIISMENYVDLIEALLSLTYNHLPQQLKVCLLYMAIFPYNYVNPWLKLAIQWIVEGFVAKVGEPRNVLEIAGMSKEELSKRGFIVTRVKSQDHYNSSVRIAEEIFHDFLVRKAKEEKFFLVINKDASYAGDTAYNQQRRLSVQQNIHRFIKDLSTCNMNSLARSLIYSGPERQYRIGAWPEEFKLLEVLDAVKIGFYTIPPEILKLMQLKYLAVSYNGQLPVALCNLQKLQVLIVAQYLNIRCSGVPSYLPDEIWNLKELHHLQVVGSDLPEPPPGTKLERLSQLLDVSARSCTRTIFERIPNVITLEVQIESLQEDENLSFFRYLDITQEDETLSFFSYLDILDNLVSFKCIVIYPDIGSQVVPCSIPLFPSSLMTLILNGCGFPWEYMSSIAALPGIKFLYLHNYAFQGRQWEVKTDEFPILEILLLEDMDLENWTFDSSTGSIFPILNTLIIRNCYKLRNIPSVFADIPTLKSLEVVDCSTSAMNSALEIKEVMMRKRGNHSTKFDIYSSRDD